MMSMMAVMSDWQTWQKFFESRRGNLFFGKQAAQAPQLVGPSRDPAPLYVVVEAESQRIVCAYAELDDLADWTGRTLEALRQEFVHREVIVISRDSVDQSLVQGLALPHLLDQTRDLQAAVEFELPFQKARAARHSETLGDWAVAPHFLLQGLESWWSRVLPSGFGLYVHVRPDDDVPLNRGEHILVVVRAGRVESFGEPDLSSLSRERRSDLGQVVKYLSESALVPIQAIDVTQSEWAEWSVCGERGGNAWALVAQAVRKNRAELVPFRWPVVCLVSARAWFQI